MSYMKKGEHDKKSNSDSRGADGAGLGLDAVAKANKIEFFEPEEGGGAQGAAAKNHWDGSGAKQDGNKEAPSREPVEREDAGSPGNGL